MSDSNNLTNTLGGILNQYQTSFSAKAYVEENDQLDLLMSVFGISPELKRENRQYWGRELGMCWQRLVFEICKQTCAEFKLPLHIGSDEPCDLIVGTHAIDTKYRIGSGDSGTLKKFKSYASLLARQGLQPVLVIVREDNLPAAITACKVGGWSIFTGDATYTYLQELTGFDIKSYLQSKALEYRIDR